MTMYHRVSGGDTSFQFSRSHKKFIVTVRERAEELQY